MNATLGTRNNVVRRILGVDPGFDRLGLAVIEGDASKPTHIWSDCVSPAKGEAADRLAAVSKAVSDAILKHQPDALAIETLFFSTNKKTALGVAEARGAVLAAAGTHKLPVMEFSPGQVKLAVTGYGSADKKAIAGMIPRLIVLPKKKRKDDELDAIAVAIAGLSTRG
ncbi:MAG: ruvC [Parcubacteria group bacterium]|nr:ruvC [Parcubacteria group bacterium]